jgi:hypothetical protein
MPEAIEFDLEPQGVIEFDLEPQTIEFDLAPPRDLRGGLELAYPDVQPVIPETKVVEASLGDILRRIPAGIASSGADAAAGILKGVRDAIAIIPSGDPNGPMFPPEDPEGKLKVATEFMREVSERARSDYGVDPERDQAFLSKVASSVGSVVPAFASGPLAPLTIAGMMGESGRSEAEQAGATPRQQDKAFYANAAVGAVSEALLGVPALLRSVKAAGIPDRVFSAMAKSAAFEALKGGLREGTQEAVEQTATNVIAKYIAEYDQNRPELQGAWESFLVGSVTGAPVGAVVQTAQNLSSQPEVVEEAQPDLQAGVVRTEDGRIFEITETGPQEVVEGSPKDLSMAVLGTKEPSKATEAQKSEPSTEAVKLSPFEPKTEGEQIISTAIMGEDGVPLSGPDWSSGHDKIIKKNPELALLEDVDSRKGFIVQDAEGNQKFVGRKQALEIARKSGQVDEASVRSAEAEGLISEALVEPKVKEPQVESPPAEPIEAPPGPPPPPEPITSQGRPPIESPTGIRNARVDANRIAQGLPPRMEPLRKTFGVEWDRAMEIVDNNPDAGSALVSELTKTPRALTPTESALRTHEQVTRENAYNEALRAVNEAPNEAVRKTAETLLSRARERNLEVYEAGQRAGTESGQSLAFLKMMVNRDYSLAAMETELVALKGGNTLKPQERAKVEAEAKALHERIKTAENRALAAEEKLARLQSQKEFEKLIGTVKQESSAARKEGKSILDRLIRNGEEASKRLKERHRSGRSMMSATIIDPIDYVDYVQVGAGYIAKGIRSVSEFTKRLVSDFGKDLEPHGERIFTDAQKLHTQANAVPRVRTVDEALARDKSTDPLDPNVVYDVARAHVNAGVTGHDPVMDATLKTLQKNRPDLTLREVRDAFSGYGKVTRPSQAEDRVKLREYRRIAQLTSAIEDAQRKIAPMKSGPQRDRATESVRVKMAELKRVMEENGIEVTSPEQQLATAERAAVTRLTNSIESLERQIASKKRDVQAKGKKADTPEIKALRERADELRKTLDEVAPRSEGERSEKASLNAVRKSIEEMDRQIREGDIASKKTKTKEPSAELEALRSERDAMRQLLKDLREEGKGKRTPEEIALARYKKAIATKTKSIEDRIKKGDYVRKPKKETVLDKDALEARFEYQKAKDAFEKKAFEYDLSRRGTVQKAYDTALEVLNTSRSVITSFDVSAPLRQGAFITLAHPIRSIKNIPSMFKAFGSEKFAFKIQESLSDPRQRPNAALYRQSGLDLTETGPNVTRRKLEEAYQSRFASKIPIVAGSQRAYTTFLNLLRADSFDSMVANLGRKGKVTEGEAKAIANFINIATGRGQYGPKLEQATQVLNSIFFAPKYVASRFQLILNPLSGFSITGGSARVRAQAAKEYGRFLLGAGVVIGLAKLAGAEVEDDPLSSEFAKIRIGNTRMDPFGGLAQVTTLLGRTFTGKATTSKGKEISLVREEGRKKKYGSRDLAGIWGTFARQKFSPIVSANVDALLGYDVVGQPITPAGAYARLLIPLSFGDIREAMKEQGVPAGTAMSLISLFGVSMSTYDINQRNKEAQEPWETLQEDWNALMGTR